MSTKYRSQTIEHWLNLLPDFSSNISRNNVSVIPKSSPTIKQTTPSQNTPIKPTVIPQPPIKQENSKPPVITVYNPNYLNDGIIPGLSGIKVALTSDKKQLITYGSDGNIKIWNIETGKLLRTLEGHSDSVNSVAITADGRTLVSGSSEQLLFYDNHP